MSDDDMEQVVGAICEMIDDGDGDDEILDALVDNGMDAESAEQMLELAKAVDS